MSIIETTAVERSTLPAIPEPQSLAPVQLEQVCRSAIEWAQTSDSIAAIRDTVNKFDAIARYMELNGRSQLAEVEATKRRLEVRIGELLGPATPNGIGHDQSHDQLDPRQRHDFRQMAEHPEVVEEVIAESTDEAPASRRKVRDRIKRKRQPEPDIDLDAERERLMEEGRMQSLNSAVRFLASELQTIDPNAVPDRIAFGVTRDIDKAVAHLDQFRSAWANRKGN